MHTPTAAGQGKNAVLGTVASTVLNPLSYSTTDLLKRIGRASITRAWIFHAAALSARMHAVGQALGAGRDAPRPIRARAAAPRGTRLRPPVSFVKTLKYMRYIKYDTCPARVVTHTAPHKTRPPTHPRDASAARANARSCPAPAWCRARKRERRRGQRARARAHARFEPAAPAAHARGGGESGRQRVRRRWYLRRRKTRWVSRRQGNLVRLSGRPGSAVRMGSKGGVHGGCSLHGRAEHGEQLPATRRARSRPAKGCGRRRAQGSCPGWCWGGEHARLGAGGPRQAASAYRGSSRPAAAGER